MRNKLKKKTGDHRSFLPGYLQSYLDAFINELSERGYTALTTQGYYSSIAHFGTWLQRKRISLKKINDNVITDFAKHRCYCRGGSKAYKVSRKYVNRVRYFISYLCQQSIIISETDLNKPLFPFYLVKFKAFLEYRGLAARTITLYIYFVSTLLPLIGDDPKKYNTALIRRVICNEAKQRSLCAVKKLTTALKAYLRFLITEGLCDSDLDTAVPTVAEWKFSSLPKYLMDDELQHVIAACDIYTKQGLRDKAIILLLSRLGLRAGDVSNMQMNDIDWEMGTLRVSGKGRRETMLPLPQEVGNAILAYIEKARPIININKLFLCLNAPVRPFPSSSGISSIVSAALSRAGITNPPSRGANLLRHTAATHMLRKGATLEMVSTILRHKSLDTTVYYAKVDIPRLTQISQPWPEGAPC